MTQSTNQEQVKPEANKLQLSEWQATEADGIEAISICIALICDALTWSSSIHGELLRVTSCILFGPIANRYSSSILKITRLAGIYFSVQRLPNVLELIDPVSAFMIRAYSDVLQL